MIVQALGGPYDGQAVQVPDKIRQIKIQVEPERPWEIEVPLNEATEIPLELIVPREIVYEVIRWYTGKYDQGNDGRMINVVVRPEFWPKPTDPLYPPWTPG